jgi:hypothetical protein
VFYGPKTEDGSGLIAQRGKYLIKDYTSLFKNKLQWKTFVQEKDY